MKTVIVFFTGVDPDFGSVRRFDNVTKIIDDHNGLFLSNEEGGGKLIEQKRLVHYQVITIAARRNGGID